MLNNKTRKLPLILLFGMFAFTLSCTFANLVPTPSRADATEYSSYRTASVVNTYRDQVWSPDTTYETHHVYDKTYKTIQYWDGYYLASTSKYFESSTQLWTCWYCVNNWNVY